MFRCGRRITQLIIRKSRITSAGYLKLNYARKQLSSNEYKAIPQLNALSLRLYSESKVETKVADYDEVVKAISNNNILLIDVREPDEVKDHGHIPNSINIPLGTISTVLGEMSDKEFNKTYKRPKPNQNTELIFYCMAGRRSAKAQESAINLGFKNTKNYQGSWTEWASKGK
ncbi:thiosulfate sulfurtransferase/rhodanese-like domain-containing protein 3 [Bombyx mandarina]|uniref:Thiosulfate sulfurtransferase/rhodanese-like domain-containing protein 3 n=1 Tax=Bombyx mandarina TaxID=7092 RepID=A0A6J2JHC3_BOMMA|nr:thiosulfate sulfurtransferase/rhodanese-like domain-containing protein 3 [Bombyx mandarina]